MPTTVVRWVAGMITFWIPIWSEMQVALLVYCQAPMKSNGAQLIYDKVLKATVEGGAAKASDTVKEE